MTGMADFVEDSGAHGLTVRLSGRLTLADLGDFPRRLEGLSASPAEIDLSGVDRIDTVGAWIVQQLAERTGARLTGASADAKRLMDLVRAAETEVRVRPDRPSPAIRVIGEIGEATLLSFKTLVGLISFFGEILIASWSLIRNPRRLRMNAVVHRFELVGV